MTPSEDPIEALSAERDRAITDACAEASQVMHRMMKDYSMRPEEAAQAVLDFYSASFDGEPIPEPQPEFCNACGQTHIPDNCDLQFEVVDLTVDLTVTIRTTEDPVEYVRNALSFRDERGNNITVTDVFRNDE